MPFSIIKSNHSKPKKYKKDHYVDLAGAKDIASQNLRLDGESNAFFWIAFMVHKNKLTESALQTELDTHTGRIISVDPQQGGISQASENDENAIANSPSQTVQDQSDKANRVMDISNMLDALLGLEGKRMGWSGGSISHTKLKLKETDANGKQIEINELAICAKLLIPANLIDTVEANLQNLPQDIQFMGYCQADTIYRPAPNPDAYQTIEKRHNSTLKKAQNKVAMIALKNKILPNWAQKSLKKLGL